MATVATMLTRLVVLQLVSLMIVNGQSSSTVSTVSSGDSSSTTTLLPSTSSMPSPTSSPSSSTSTTTVAASTSPSTTTSTTTTTTTTSPSTTTTSMSTTTISTEATTTVAAVSSSVSTSTASSSAASSTTAMSSSSSSVNPSTSTSSPSSLSASASTKTAAVPMAVKLTFDNDPNYARVVAAVVGGCGLFLLNTVFFVIVAVLIRYSMRLERHKMPKPGGRGLTGGSVAFYGGQEVQSAQALFAPSLSATNIVSGASDIQLDARGGRGVYLNRGFESGQPAFGGDSGLQSPGYDSGYKPIEIKSQGFAGSSRA